MSIGLDFSNYDGMRSIESVCGLRGGGYKVEILDVVDEKGNPTGKTVEREKAHEEGIMHRTSHVWLLRKRCGRTQILLQKRCETKESFPGCYDISSAGHIPAGMDFAQSAIRELKEELGVSASEDELIFCGDRIVIWDDCFYGRPFHDRQYSRVFALWHDIEEEKLTLQKEEVDSVLWMDLDKCIELVETDQINHCIYPEELRMVKDSCDGN
ncbi:Isopentenyl-diphosphate Delta-isomerase [Clostridium sp. N3C]|uniref:NUDIX hydrolase n=1 Tax=Clostridium sp. N3C TaxID=1776758 RepID=UPI00092E0FAB|nr:Isopentenyl-diphosphate Delta-isomerase [Clostridium sp. N3C]